MQPFGKLPVTFQLQGRSHNEDMRIYPEISGVIMSWKAAKGLSILPVNYPDPLPVTVATAMPPELIDLLKLLHVITPVTEATTWCTPIVVTPKKTSDKI